MIQTDVLIIGAGPCGLFQVFELGLLGLQAHVIESLDKPGGQCAELYPDKPIYDIPALPECGALELIERLSKQIEPFDATFHYFCEARNIEKQGDRFCVRTSTDAVFDVGAVVIAAGAGSFQPVILKAEGMQPDFTDSYIFYQIKNARQHYDKRLMVLGGGDSALDWTLNLQPHSKSMVLVHRTERFRAQPASVAQVDALADNEAMQKIIATVTKVSKQQDGLHVQLTSKEHVQELVVDHILCFYGLIPKLGPIADWDLVREKHQLVVDTEKFETSYPGIYAVGDINVYPGKKKLILSGFHEAALAAFAIKARLFPDEKQHLQHTTTSPLIKQRLGK